MLLAEGVEAERGQLQLNGGGFRRNILGRGEQLLDLNTVQHKHSQKTHTQMLNVSPLARPGVGMSSPPPPFLATRTAL